MPCEDDSHRHVWPESGDLTIERCEVFCQYCTGADRKHRWKFAWFLRRHVQAAHIKRQGASHPDVVLAGSWTRSGKPTTNARPSTRKKAPTRAKKSGTSETPSRQQSQSPPRDRTFSPPPAYGAETGDDILDHFIAEQSQSQSSGDEQQQPDMSELSDIIVHGNSGALDDMDPFTATMPFTGGDDLNSFALPSIESADELAQNFIDNGLPTGVDNSLYYDTLALNFGNTTEPSGFTTPPPSFGSQSHSRTSSLSSISPLSTPQRRIGDRVELQYPQTPTSTMHFNEVRDGVNTITKFLEERGAKEGIVAAALMIIGENYQNGVAH